MYVQYTQYVQGQSELHETLFFFLTTAINKNWTIQLSVT